MSKVKWQMSKLFQLLADMNSLEIRNFLSSFMTESELIMFSKRLAILKLLSEGKSYQEIKTELKVSSATIASTSDLLQKEGVQLALNKIEVDDWAERLLVKIGF